MQNKFERRKDPKGFGNLWGLGIFNPERLFSFYCVHILLESKPAL